MMNNQPIYIKEERCYYHPNQDPSIIISQQSYSSQNQESLERVISFQVYRISLVSYEKAQNSQSQLSHYQNKTPKSIFYKSSSSHSSNKPQIIEFGSLHQIEISQQEQFSQQQIYSVEQINDELKKKEKNYALGSCIEQGGESFIYEDIINKNVIIKIIYVQMNQTIDMQKKIFDILKDEKNFLQLIDHIKIYDNLHIFIHEKFQKNLQQELENFNKDKNIFTEQNLIKMIFNLIHGLIDLKNKNILHLDIKPKNILVDNRGNYIYTDFGISEIYQEGNMQIRGKTDNYSSQEQRNQDVNKISYKSDVYSLGKTLLKVIERFKELNGQSKFIKFAKSIQDIVKKSMVQEDINQRDDCYLIHSQFSDQLFKIKSKIDLNFIKEIGFEINHYLTSYLSQTDVVVDRKKVEKQVKQDWSIYVIFFYFNCELENDQFANVIKEIQLNSEIPTELNIYWEKNMIEEDILPQIDNFFKQFTKIKIYSKEELMIENKNGSINTQPCLLQQGHRSNLNLSLKTLTKVEGDTFIDDIQNISNVSYLYLQLTDNKVNEKKVNTFLEKFQNATYLNLDQNWNIIDDEGAKDLGAGIAQCQDKNIGEQGAKHLGTGIAKCQNITTLTLDLNWNNIGAQGAKHLGTGIAKCQNIATLTLDLNKNNIGAQGAKDLGSEIAQCKYITTLRLNLYQNNICDDGVKDLGKEIAKCKKITTLTLDLNWNNIGAQGAKNLGTGIAQCKKITTLTLDLKDNNIGAQGAKDLGTAIAQCKNITTLKLDLNQNNIGDDGVKNLGNEIAKYKNITTLTLDLKENNIGEQGAKDLGTEIAQCQKITTLTLGLNWNKIGAQGAKQLGTSIALCKNITTLTLDLNKNNIGEEGAKGLGIGIAQCQNIKILTLFLQDNNIGAQGAKDLGTAIAQCKNIITLTLDLYLNKIGGKSTKEQVTGIALCKNITTLTLNLKENNIGAQDAKDLGTGIAQCKNITTLTLDLQENNIGAQGAKDLGTGIANCKNIITLMLDLYKNKIGDEGAKDLGAEIAQCKNITTLTLNLKENNIGVQCAKVLATAIAQCKNIITPKLHLQ
ncbi:Serine/Threonine kinase domain protein (macronuclear) [Tetrahymena thermophila SB210]|uniref:Serine/Threonine kinase domain protein n=1 Tax=Tetrahymena thermophila (strain SB210) TaxID=312017 RepID=Q23UH2_TETTS|nr:Serine/Threonine kinase domain protein [Tetrahymena thermophila SB210]EAS00186.2 Serine/Threonine kinase domain protein [Tetrahymena thermophila SB210]|eukprot:XP_001020431.2 Serine/Threonine kinase domain protein [Tetrahymena thermophila SB210]